MSAPREALEALQHMDQVTMPSDPRRATGARGEEIAARHLVDRGYRILDRNFRTRFGELDIVAADPRAIVFCEVKTRIGAPRAIGALDSIGPRKRRQVRAMAMEWLQTSPPGGNRPYRDNMRFDAIAVTLRPNGALLRLEHVPDAF
jgi:putative endonuclease